MLAMGKRLFGYDKPFRTNLCGRAFLLAVDVRAWQDDGRSQMLEERFMTTLRKQNVSIYVNRLAQQWVVRDPEGNFWIVPVVEDPWGHRQPVDLTDEMELEPVPGHYKYLLGLPF